MAMSALYNIPSILVDERLTVDVVNIRYRPLTRSAQVVRNSVANCIKPLKDANASPNTATGLVQSISTKIYNDLFESEKSAKLDNITFRASPGELTAVLAKDLGERRTIMELLAGRRSYGEFDGDVFIHGKRLNSKLINMAYVSKSVSTLYTPGLTYLEMLRFSARMRMNLKGSSSDMTAAVHERVMQLLHVMELVWCKDRVITERPSMRGTLGGELRRLSIAVEFIGLPPVLVLQDPTTDLDGVVSSKLVECLLKFAEKGHTVVSSFPKPAANVFSQFNKVVLSSEGHTIYASSLKNIEEYFTSSPLDYHLAESVEMIDFVLDIASGVERPRGSRKPIPVDQLQAYFQSSAFFEPCELGDCSINVLPQESVPYYGYRDVFLDSWRLNDRTWVIFYRAFYVKLKELEVLRKSFGASVGLGLFFGYFMWNLGNFGDYCLSLLGTPYNEVSSLSACLFIVAFIIYGQQVMNVHIICQKMIAFRHERRARCSPTVGFLVATVLSEAIFVTFFALLFSNIIYWFSSLNSGYQKYFYIEGLHIVSGYIGLATTLAFTAVVRREIVVRDLFLLTLLLMGMTAGFLFPLGYMKDNIVTISNINPFRWVYAASMVWKYRDYVDGTRYLMQYQFQNFRTERVWWILAKFFIFDFCLIFLGLMPRPITLHRFQETERVKSMRDSTDKRYNERHSEPVKPNIFLRESSITTKRSLASQGSQQSKTGADQEGEISRGPNVTFKRLCYRVSDIRSPFGFKHVLHPMNGRFEWGKLSAIMGSPGSGKSSLLHVLGGQLIGTASDIGGAICFDEKPIDDSLLPWQHCAFVEAIDDHFRDLTVRDVLTYAMQLRCIDVSGMKYVETNVLGALDLLNLTDVEHVKTKDLTSGQLRRLSIGEEIVHGPNLICMDEPITDLDERDTATIMTGAIRELVNQERTVIATFHQPSSVVFELFDTLALLSKGRLVYLGKASEALGFFIESPSLQFTFSDYGNPADFLTDISGCTLQNQQGEYVDAPMLDNHYKGSRFSEKVDELINGITFVSDSITSETHNPVTQNSTSTNGRSRTGTSPELSTDEPSTVSTDDSRVLSMSVAMSGVNDSIRPASQANQRANRTLLHLYVPIMSAWKSFISMSIIMQFVRMKIILVRSFFVLFKRYKMVLGTTVLHVLMACTFCIIIGETGPDIAVVTPVAAFGGLLLILSGVQYVFWLFANNKVFLKEHNRGLYSTLHHWLVSDLPLLVLRSGQVLIYAAIIHVWVDLQGGNIEEFYYYMIWLSGIAAMFLVEAVVYILPDVRSAYSFIPMFAILLFIFSGMIFKPSTLPHYLSPYIPSVSVIRWIAQGTVLNEFDSNDDLYPPIGPQGGYSVWEAYLVMFGWGGKTKWYCFNVIMMNIAIYRVLTLLASIKSVIAQKGKRGLRVKVTEEQLY